MKHPIHSLRLVLVVALLLTAVAHPLAVNAQAERVVDPNYKLHQNAFKASPFHFLANTMRLSYERSLFQGHGGVQIASFLIVRNPRWNVGNEQHLAIGSNLQYRIYYAGDFQNGKRKPAHSTVLTKGYAAPYYQIRYGELRYDGTDEFGGITISDNNFLDQMLANEGGFLLGLQTTMFDRIVFDFNFGGGFRHAQVVTDNPFGARWNQTDLINASYTGVVPKIGFQVGVAF